MADIAVSGEGLGSLRESLARTAQGIAEELRTLDEKVARLRGEWSGDASDAYDSAQREWTACLDEMGRILQEYSERVSDIDARYRQATQTIAGKIWK